MDSRISKMIEKLDDGLTSPHTAVRELILQGVHSLEAHNQIDAWQRARIAAQRPATPGGLTYEQLPKGYTLERVTVRCACGHAATNSRLIALGGIRGGPSGKSESYMGLSELVYNHAPITVREVTRGTPICESCVATATLQVAPPKPEPKSWSRGTTQPAAQHAKSAPAPKGMTLNELALD